MNNNQLESHIDALEKLFPDMLLRSTDAFYGWDSDGKQGMWTTTTSSWNRMMRERS